jgi:CAAX protease family protein
MRGIMAAAATKIKARQLVWFFAFAFAFAWAFAGLAMAGLIPAVPAVLLASWAPTVAALGVLAASGGGKTLRRWARGYLKFKMPLRWYAAAFSPLAVVGLAVAFNLIVLGNARGKAESELTPMLVLGSLLLMLVMGSVAEEPGWRGFALPRLQVRASALISSLILGAVWVIWHVPLWFIPDSGFEKINFPMFALLGVSFAVILTWIFNNTKGSFVGVILAHLSSNYAGSFLAIEGGLISEQTYFKVAPVLWAVYAITVILIAGPANLSRQRRIEEPALSAFPPATAIAEAGGHYVGRAGVSTGTDGRNRPHPRLHVRDLAPRPHGSAGQALSHRPRRRSAPRK